MELYETLFDYVTPDTPTVTLPVYEMTLSATPDSESSQTQTHISKNLFNFETATLGKYINATGTESDSVSPHPQMVLNHSALIPASTNTAYTISAQTGGSTPQAQTIAFCWYLGDILQSRSLETIPSGSDGYTITKTSPASNCDNLIINYFTSDQETVMLNSGSTAQHYEPHGTTEITNLNLRFSGADLSFLFDEWPEVPKICTDAGCLMQCDCIMTELANTEWAMTDTTYSSWSDAQPADWETEWMWYLFLVTRNPTGSYNRKVRQYFPPSRQTWNNWSEPIGSRGYPTHGSTWLVKNIPENPAKKLMRIFCTKAGGSYGLSVTGKTQATTYPTDFVTVNRVGGFAPTSTLTDPPYSNYPYSAMFRNDWFSGCYGSASVAGQYLGYMAEYPADEMHNQVMILVHFKRNNVDYYGYLLMSMTADDSSGVPDQIQIVAFSENYWGDSVQPFVPPEPSDPSGPESTTGGGDGTWTYTSDDRGGSDGSAIDTILTDTSRIQHVNDIINGGGFNVYQIRPQAVSDVVGVLYGSGYFSRFENYMYNPLSSVLSYHLLPAAFTSAVQSGGSDLKRNLTAGGYDITANMQTPEQFVILESLTHAHIGFVDLSAYFGAYTDYAPYTKITLHLPYIGDIEIDPNVCMRGTLAVDYLCDVVSGNVCAWVYTRDKNGHSTYLYSGTGNCAYNVPLYTQSADGSAVGKIVGGAAGLIAGGVTGNVLGLVGGAAALASGLVGLDARQTHGTGTFAGNVSILQDTVCYLHIQRPHWCNPADYQALHGLPMHVSGTISALSLTGFVKLDRIETDGIAATDPELREIERLLLSGIWINPTP